MKDVLAILVLYAGMLILVYIYFIRGIKKRLTEIEDDVKTLSRLRESDLAYFDRICNEEFKLLQRKIRVLSETEEEPDGKY